MQCLHPVSIPVTPVNKETGEMDSTRYILVPCRKCIACKSNRRSEWSFRLLYESLDSDFNNYFITLTYEDANLPIKEFHEGYMPCFNKKHVQDFMKRLRRHYEPNKIRFYLSSELGTHTLRPHYHAVLFNVPENLSEFRKTLEKKWHLGRVQADFLNSQRMGYVSKYIMKQSFLEDLPRSDERTPFMLCSKGIGRCYVNIYANSHHGFDSPIPFAFTYDKRKQVLPKYLKDKIFSENEKAILSEQAAVYRSYHPLSLNTDYYLDDKLEKQVNQVLSFRAKL